MAEELTWPQVCDCVYFEGSEADDDVCECGHQWDEHGGNGGVCIAAVYS